MRVCVCLPLLPPPSAATTASTRRRGAYWVRFTIDTSFVAEDASPSASPSAAAAAAAAGAAPAAAAAGASDAAATASGASSSPSSKVGSKSPKAKTPTAVRLERALSSLVDKIDKELRDIESKIGDDMHMLDENRDGVISASELHGVLKNVLRTRRGLTDREVSRLVQTLDQDGDGRIDLEDIQKLDEKKKVRAVAYL